MVQIDKQRSKDILLESVSFIEKKGFDNIKADIEGYETPKSFHKKSTGEKITPDIVAERSGVKHYFEIGVKSQKPNLLKSKWRLLAVMSKTRNAKFKIITHRGHYRFTREILNDLNLSNTLIKI